MIFLAEAVSTAGDNFQHFAAGYVAAFIFLLLMIVSLWWRYRSLAADEAALEQLEGEVEKEKRKNVPAESREAIHAR